MISAKTRLAVLLGSPVAHSRSPAMLNAAFAARKIDAVYLAWDISEELFAQTVATLQALGALGANVTVPHKALAASFGPSPEVRLLGAANCLVFGTSVRAHNTDAPGLARALAEDVRRVDGPVTLLGAGGAARAALFAIAERGAKDVHIVNRSAPRQKALLPLAKKLGLRAAAHAWEALPDVLCETKLLINATSAQVRAEALMLPLERLHRRAIVYDLTYGQTPLLTAAKKAGLRAYEGSGMLLHQAAIAFELWTNKRAPLQAMRAALGA